MLHVSVSVQSADRTDETNAVSPETEGIVLFKDIKNVTYVKQIFQNQMTKKIHLTHTI